jgi:FkbM family methyltransferase
MRTLNRNRNIFDYLRNKIAKKYLKKICREHIKERNQLIVYSFDFISQSIFIDGRFEDAELNLVENKFKRFLKDNVVLDVGANIGNHTVAFSKYAKKVYAFEPNQKVFEVLNLNTKDLNNVEIFNYGASNKKQSIIAKIPKLNCGGGSVVSEAKAKDKNMFMSMRFNLVALDKLKKIQSHKVGLVKIDVEGHELEAFKGMQQILKNHKPIILFEQNRGILNGTSDVINFLRSIGYDNLYELKKVDDWVLKKFIPKLFKSLFEFIEVLLIGVPSNKLQLKPIKYLTKSSYDMLVMSNSELNK